MKSAERARLGTVMSKLSRLASQVDNLDEKRKMNRAINILMTIIHPKFIPSGCEAEGDSFQPSPLDQCWDEEN